MPLLWNSFAFHIIIIIMYLYSAQYLHILQDSKCYLTNPTVQVQPQLTSNQGTKLSQNSFGTTGLTTCGSYWSVRKFISPICKQENKKLLHGYYVHPPGGWIYYFCFFRRPMSDVRCPMSDVRRPMSGVTHGFRSFKGKVLELLSPNLVCRLIGSVACLGLLLAVVPLLLTE